MITEQQSRYKATFVISSISIIIILLMTIFFPKGVESTVNYIHSWNTANLSWFYVLTVSCIICTVFYLGFGKYGKLKIGKEDITPEYGNATWFSMLFSAGIGIGLLFFGVSEPVQHFMNPPPGTDDKDHAVVAMNMTFLHWGIHAWATYSLIGLILGYFAFKHDMPLTIRSALFPILGNKVFGRGGDFVDSLTVLCTVFGLATSLGYGALQINSGLNFFTHINVSSFNQAYIIILITVLAAASVYSGLNRGVKWLSQANILLAVVLMLYVFLFGEDIALLKYLLENIGYYAGNFISTSLTLYAYESSSDWMGGWTLFYWGWLLAWGPFVGQFIAKISKGRTIKEYVLGVTLVPALFSFIWMTVFGNTAINLIIKQTLPSLGRQVAEDPATALFHFLSAFPLSEYTFIFTVVLILSFFLTSHNAGAVSIGSLTCSHTAKQLPYVNSYWAIVIGVVAMSLLLVGGLKALQTATISSAAPFAIIVLMSIYSLIKTLAIDYNRFEVETKNIELLVH